MGRFGARLVAVSAVVAAVTSSARATCFPAKDGANFFEHTARVEAHTEVFVSSHPAQFSLELTPAEGERSCPQSLCACTQT